MEIFAEPNFAASVTSSRDIHLMSPDYPTQLRDLANAPPIISVEGALDLNARPVLGVVGARDSSIQAETWMRVHLPRLAEKCLIVSGGARGIDELAHQIALHAKQPTAVVLPSSLDRPYPAHWGERKKRVLLYGGCFVSEYEAGTLIRKSHFEKRNRLIAALSDVVLVVEARRRSGTGITARHARDLNRTVATLPWFASDPRGELCNDLIADATAFLVRDAADVQLLLTQAFLSRDVRRACSQMARLQLQGLRSTVPDSFEHEETGNAE